IRINSKNFVEVMKTVSPTLNKGARNKRVPACIMKANDETVAAFLSAFIDGDGGTYRNPRSVCFFSASITLIRQLQGLLLRFGAISKITESTKKGYGPCYRLLVQGNSLKTLSKYLKLAQERKRKILAENEAATKNKKRFASLDTVPHTGSLINSARKKLGVYGYALGLSRGTLSVFERGLNKPSKEALKKIVAALKKASDLRKGTASEEIGRLEFLAESDLQFDEIIALNEINGEKFVYNLSVEEDKNFIANGIIVHNSDEDRGLMHEAMEQQFVSIAKAGIVTQFKAAASVLAAANPKMGRFDPMKPPGEQFAMGPALISRFDLIFAIKDFPDETRDRGLVEHVLTSHKLASENKIPEAGSPINPEIEPELLQKYIAYARQNVFPILTDAAMKKIEEYYIHLRKVGEKQGNIAVTPRQLEGLVRLSEANAKMRLSDKVEAADAERAIAIVNFVLEEIYVDKETGRIDSDVINIGQPKSRIDKMRSLLGVISELEKQTDLVAIEDVFRDAAKYGMDETYVRQLIETLERQGDLYRPKAGHVKSARKREW
ncbi:MAG: LAGLIDADG family homing endonuclease, partial [Candidatus Micrarchaeota archaeon]